MALGDIKEYLPLCDREALECYVARCRYLFDRQSSHDVMEISRFPHEDFAYKNLYI